MTAQPPSGKASSGAGEPGLETTTGRQSASSERISNLDDVTTRVSKEISLLDLVALFLRHRWWILGFTLGIPFVVGLWGLLSPRDWSATTSFMPQAATAEAQSRLASLAGQFGFDISGAEAGQSPEFYADLVQSRAILGTVATDTFEVADTTGLFARGMLRGTLADLMEIKTDEPRTDVRRAAAIDWLQEAAISVSTNSETGVVDLSVKTPWPRLSQHIATRIVDLVNDFNMETRQSEAGAERRFIGGRVEKAESDLRSAENALQAFLQRNRDYQNSPELLFEHDRLQRQVGMQQDIYTSLMQSYEQARISEVRNTPVITIVEKAEEPVRPVRRHLVVKVAVAMFMGALLGFAIALAREYARHRRQEDPEAMREVTDLWTDAKSDVARLTRRLRRST